MKRNQVEAEFAATARKGRILCRAKVAGPRDRAEDSSAAISILNLFVQDRDTRSSYCVWKRGGNHTTTTWDSLEIPTPPDSHGVRVRAGAEGMAGREKAGAPKRAMRRCLILRQGASPLRPPAPFPSALILGNRSELSRVRKPCIRTPLTAPIGSQRLPYMTERGPKNRGIRQLRLVPLQ